MTGRPGAVVKFIVTSSDLHLTWWIGLVHSDGTNIWDEFDDAVERAKTGLKQARTNYELIEQTGEPLPEVYRIALAELDEAVEQFNSIYEVTATELDRAQIVAAQAEFLVAVTAAHRSYYETVVDRRVVLIGEWFDALNSAVEDADGDISADRSTLARQVQAVRKLVTAEKYGQIQSSDRINLEGIEEDVQSLHGAIRESFDPIEYVPLGLQLAESFKDHYTADLSALVGAGVDRGAISVADDLKDVPELESISSKLEDNDVTDMDADAVGTAAETHADVALLTGTRRARYELGKELLSAIEESDLVDDANAVEELRPQLSSFDIGVIEERVEALIEGEATTSETERLLQLLAEYDGSVRRTLKTVDRSPDEVFKQLQMLLTENEIEDLEVQFE